MSKKSNTYTPTVENRDSAVVRSGKVLVFGDLHLDPYFIGMHRSYLDNCLEVMDKLLKYVKDEEASAVILAGDVIGVNAKNIVDRRFLLKVVHFFEVLNKVTHDNVYAVKGNHDMGDFTDYDFLLGLGLFKNPKYIDYMGVEEEIRFHLVNYGDEKERLSLHPSASNVVIGHNDYYIPGVTTWYSSSSSLELNKLSNFEGVEMVLAGHIHEPSEEFLYTNLPNGKEIGLFYMGNPTRVKERFVNCWYIVFEYNSEEASSNYACKLFKLKPVEEEFYNEEDFNKVPEEEQEDKEKEERRQQVLKEVIEEVMESRLAVGDLFGQIDRLPGKPAAKELAKSYLEKAGKEV